MTIPRFVHSLLTDIWGSIWGPSWIRLRQTYMNKSSVSPCFISHGITLQSCPKLKQRGRSFLSPVIGQKLSLGIECYSGWGRSLLQKETSGERLSCEPQEPKHLQLGEWGSWSDGRNLGSSPQHLLHQSEKFSPTAMSCFLLRFPLELLWFFYIYVCDSSQIYFYAWRELGIEVHFFTYRYPVVPAPFVEKTSLSLLNFLVSLLKINWPHMCGSIFGLSILFHWSIYPYMRQCFESTLAEAA